MMIEVYAIPLASHTKDTTVSKVNVNKRLVDLTKARIRPNLADSTRAEIALPSGSVLVCAGGYDDLMTRLKKAEDSGKFIGWI